MIGRREFLGVLGAAAWPVAAWGQQAAMPVVGFLNVGSSDVYARLVSEFLNGMSEAGFVENRNFRIVYRWAEGESSRLPAMAADLVQQSVSVIAATGGSPAALAAKMATKSIPIVFQVGVDPVEIGLVPNLNHPGGNITGATILAVELASKRLEILHELVPLAKSIAALINPTSPGAAILAKDLPVAAQKLGLILHVIHASHENDFEPAFSQLRSGALVVAADPLFNARREQLAKLSARYRVPAIYQFREFAEAGGLASYGGNLNDAYRVAGAYVARILKGERPGELPVQQSTKVEFILNLKAAKSLGLTPSLPLLGRADEVIE